MALFELTGDRTLEDVRKTTFAAEHVMERADLQRALRERIEVLDPELKVVSEEYDQFEVNRRIDLLCVDRTGQLVVVELKRTEDGGHVELQALRYAAMVSVMTFDQLVGTYERHLRTTGSTDADQARDLLADWLEDGDETVLPRTVRIILVAAGFDTQITTTVLWLRDLYGLDITCVRLTPYRFAERLVLDVQQVIPLPEAAELTVKLRHRENAARAVASSDNKDRTRYAITSPSGTTEPLPKRWAVLELVTQVRAAGVSPTLIAGTMRPSKFLTVEGELTGEALRQEFFATYPLAERNQRKWFLDAPVHGDGRTWVLSNQWGLGTVDVMQALVDLAPEAGISYAAEP